MKRSQLRYRRQVYSFKQGDSAGERYHCNEKLLSRTDKQSNVAEIAAHINDLYQDVYIAIAGSLVSILPIGAVQVIMVNVDDPAVLSGGESNAERLPVSIDSLFGSRYGHQKVFNAVGLDCFPQRSREGRFGMIHRFGPLSAIQGPVRKGHVRIFFYKLVTISC